MHSNIFILSGPSGAGEDSIIEKLSGIMPIERVITTTTRQMRDSESEGRPYYFISREEFQNGINEEKFVEYAQQYNDNLYGVTREELDRATRTGKTVLWKIEYQGVMSVKKILPNIKSIFITVPSLSILADRLRRRGGATENHITERMEYTKEWMKHADIYDFTVINEEGRLNEAVEEVRSIITSNQ